MRAALRLSTRVKTIPRTLMPLDKLRLPEQGYKAPKPTNKGNPTLTQVLHKAEFNALFEEGPVPTQVLPSNLRLEEFIPPRQLYSGISQEDREIVSMSRFFTSQTCC